MAKKVALKKVKKQQPSLSRKPEKVLESKVDSKEAKIKQIRRYSSLWIVLIFLVILGAFLYFAKSLFVVAMVNGKPITRWSLIDQLERTNGQTALDSLVNKTLIEQAAKKENIRISDEDIQSELEKLRKDLEAQGMNLDAALSSQGMTMQDFQDNLKMKQTVERLLKDNINVSDEEVKKYFEDNKSALGENPTYEELEPSIREQLKGEKLSAEFQTWYEKIKSESDIRYFLSF